jgi:hypothetical protein
VRNIIPIVQNGHLILFFAKSVPVSDPAVDEMLHVRFHLGTSGLLMLPQICSRSGWQREFFSVWTLPSPDWIKMVRVFNRPTCGDEI